MSVPRPQIDAALRDRALLVRALEIAGAKVSDRRAVKCPFHGDQNASGDIHRGDEAKWWFTCHAGGCCWNREKQTGDAIDVVRAARNCSFSEACRLLGIDTTTPNKLPGRSRTTKPDTFTTSEDAITAYGFGKPSSMHEYRKANGELAGVVARWDRPDRKIIRPVSQRGLAWVKQNMRAPRPLYYQPELLADDRPVLVVEGEVCADQARQLDLNATTWAGGSNAVAKSDWKPLAGKTVILWPDNDPAGRKAMDQIAATLLKLDPSTSIKVIDTSEMELPEHGDIVDFFEARDSRDTEDLRAMVEAQMNEAPDWKPRDASTSKQATPTVPAYEPFPVDSLPEPVREFVKAVAGATGTDPAFAALAALVVLAGCIGNRLWVIAKGGWSEACVLWGALIGRSGVTKSPVLKITSRALVELFKERRRQFSQKLREYERDLEQYKARFAEWKKAQAEGPSTDPPVKPTEPVEERLFVSDITIEKLGCMHEENPLGLLVVRDELAAWVGSFDRYASGGKGSDQSNWLSLFDGAPVVIDRKSGKGNYFVERGATSVLGTIQPGTLARMFGQAEREAGLLGRILGVYPPERESLWTEECVSEELAESWMDLLRLLIDMPPGSDKAGNPCPRFIPIGNDAKPLWVQWHNDHMRETLQISDDDLAAHFSKLKGICLRFALIFFAVDSLARDSSLKCIGPDAMGRAIEVTEWFKRHGRRTYAILAETHNQRQRRELVDWIRARGGGVTERDLYTMLKRRYPDQASASAALDDLRKHRLGDWEFPKPGPKGGQPKRQFRLFDAPVEATLTGPQEPETPRHDPENGGTAGAGAEVDAHRQGDG